MKRTTDPAQPKGDSIPAIAYSLTVAMSPLKKETAFLHLPTYAAGIIYHLGTFLSFFLLLPHFFDLHIAPWMARIVALLLAVSSLSGFSVLIKRITQRILRALSSPDDYASNLLVTGFQALSSLALLWNRLIPVLFIYTSILFLYIPLGKLKHAVYFFTSRIQLGIFYGKRGVWPTRRQSSLQG